MEAPLLAAIVLGLSVVLIVLWSKVRRAAQAEYIRAYMFPSGLFEKFRRHHPALSAKDCQLVARALRQFFLVYLNGRRRFVSMPSQVVDDLWHEFILYTRHYDEFCRKSFGQFLHHTPVVVLSMDRKGNAGLRRAWWYACLEENINPRTPTRLPLLFALDTKLNIPNGFRYAPDCKRLRAGETTSLHCGADFSSDSFDGTTDGFGDAGTGDGGSGGDGGSCSGGCGGGCGGD